MKSKEIPITELKELSKKYDKNTMVLISYDELTDTTWVTTYGKTVKECKTACELGNDIKRFLGWPEEHCKAICTKTKNDV